MRGVNRYISQFASEAIHRLDYDIDNMDYCPDLASLEDETPVDVVTFIDDPFYLNQRDSVFDSVRWILELFYHPEKHIDDYADVGIDALDVPSLKFNELVCMCGMRALKSTLCGIMTLYEVYRLLCLPDPQEHYNLMRGTDIYATCCATASKQAGDTVYSYVETFRDSSPWFRSYISALSKLNDYSGRPLYHMTGSEFRFRHKHITCNYMHSRSAGLHGVARKIFVIDEIARFDSSDGPRSARKVYEAATTTTSTFGLDGLRVCISAPEHEYDMICERYASSGVKFESADLAEIYNPITEVYRDDEIFPINPDMNVLGFHYPTWELNPHKPFDCPDFVAKRESDPQGFWKIFGAVPPHARQAYFTDASKVQDIFDPSMPLPWNDTGQLRDDFYGDHAINYIMHVDPGLGRPCRFGIALAHSTYHPNPPSSHENTLYVIDFAHAVAADHGTGEVDFERVYELIIHLIDRFNIVSITSDRWNDAMMRQRLARYTGMSSYTTDKVKGLGNRTPKIVEGVQTRVVSASDYDELKRVIYRGCIKCHPYDILEGELLGLEYVNGKPERGINRTKDVSDCIASVVVQLSMRTGQRRVFGSATEGVYRNQSSSEIIPTRPAVKRPEGVTTSGRAVGGVARGVL